MRGWLVALALWNAIGISGANAQDLGKKQPLNIVRGPTYSDAIGGAARACFHFNANLDYDGDVRWADYVRVEPAADISVTAESNRLCISGLPRRVEREITILAGLPSPRNGPMPDARVFTLEPPARAPQIGFRGDGHVLPSGGAKAVPITTVNVNEAELTAYFIPARNLSAAAAQGLLFNALGHWQANQVQNEAGEKVWEGTLEVDGADDADHTAQIPLDAIIPDDTRRGVYVLRARRKDEDRYRGGATQWILRTDLGLTTLQGADGLTVFIRSMDNGKPQAGVELALLARNNAVLGRVTTDRSGLARFDPGLLRGEGGRAPRWVLAEKGATDFAFLRLDEYPLNLTDRGADGRARPGPVDAFLYAERDLYRPGETAHVTVLLRDDDARALEDLPVTLRVVRPDQRVVREWVQEPAQAGAVALAVDFPAQGLTGAWRVDAYLDPDGAPIGSLPLQVQEFAPPTVDFRVVEAPERVRADADFTIRGQADFYYGAPAADLRVEGVAIATPLYEAFPDLHPDFLFGDTTDKRQPERIALDEARTGDDGAVAFTSRFDALRDARSPYQAQIRVTLFEPGGRPVNAVAQAKISTADRFIGLRSKMRRSYRNRQQFQIARDEPAAFDVVGVDADGAGVAIAGASWRLVREEVDYIWYFERGYWRARVQARDRVVATGDLDVAADGAVELTFEDLTLQGRYRIEITDPVTGASTVLRFHSGYGWGRRDLNRPDMVEVILDRDAAEVGDRVTATIRPPFEADVLVTVATERVLETRYIKAGPDGAEVRLAVGESWGPGAHIMATAFRRGRDDQALGPERAVGLAWAGVDRPDRRAEIVIEAPETARPQSRAQIKLDLPNVRGGEAFVTLAAVEEGALALTGFATPDPFEHYFDRRALGVSLRDFYSRVITPALDAQLGVVRTGGDRAMAGALMMESAADRAQRGKPDSGIEIVSLYAGPVRVENGEAVVPLDLPDFNGRLRLMAVAWTKDQIGSAESAMTVRAPLVAELARPRFLAPGDRAELALSLRNLDAPEGRYSAELLLSGPIEIDGAGAAAASLAPGEENRTQFGIRATDVGQSQLRLIVTGPNGYRDERAWRLPVRSPEAPQLRRELIQLASGDRFTASPDLLADYLPGSAEASLTLSGQPPLDVAGVVESLYRYPYGCIEQTISSATPLAYIDRLEENWNLTSSIDNPTARAQSAIYSVVDRQRPDGWFGLWGWRSKPNKWLTAYVADFLLTMRDLDYVVPDGPLNAALDALEVGAVRQLVSTGDIWREADAYGLYVLARAGRAHAGHARYFADQFGDQLRTAAAKAHVAAAMALLGDRDRADALFDQALTTQRPRRHHWYDYGAEARDRALIAALAAETGMTDAFDFSALVQTIAQDMSSNRRFSTQAQAWMVRLAAALPASADIEAKVAGDIVSQAATFQREGDAWSAFEIENAGARPFWLMTGRAGVPNRPSPPAENGYRIRRSWFTSAGEPIELDEVVQGDTLIAVIDVEDTSLIVNETLLVDMLPAGFELENAVLGGQGAEAFPWLPTLAVDQRRGYVYEERRDDRYAASLSTARDVTVRFAYAVRAVTPGDYVVPAPYVEDMYAPNLFGRGDAGRVTVRAKP